MSKSVSVCFGAQIYKNNRYVLRSFRFNLFAGFPVAAFAVLVLGDDVEQMGLVEVGPEHGGEEEFGVGDLPEQEVADALLAAGADEDVGVGKKGYYSLCNVAIPFGLGFRFTFGKFFSLGAEWGMRFTFTDYLDDVSGEYYDNQELKDHRGSVVARLADKSENIHTAGAGRGNSTTKDFYSFAGATITFKIGNEDRSCDIRYNARKKVQHRLGKKN